MEELSLQPFTTLMHQINTLTSVTEHATFTDIFYLVNSIYFIEKIYFFKTDIYIEVGVG